MTREEFCRLTGIDTDESLKSDFANIHTLYMAAGGMGKKDFCEEFKNLLTKERMPAGFEEDKGRCFFYIPLWASEVADTIERLDAEKRRLRAMVRDLEEAAREREATIKSLEEAAKERDEEEQEKKKNLAYELRLLGSRLDNSDLKCMAEELCGAEFTARKAMLHGLKLTENEENALVVAMEELDVYRGEIEVTREGERPDAAAAAGADS